MTNRKPRGYWTKETLVNEALKYSNTSEFVHGSPGGSRIAQKLGIYAEITSHFVPIHKTWSKSECVKFAQDFTSLNDVIKADERVYRAALRNGWIDDISVHMTRGTGLLTRLVYEIADHSRRVVYIGLTCDAAKRERQHRNSLRMQKAFPNGVCLTPVSGMLSENEAAELEQLLIAAYKARSYVVVNVARAGGLGANNRKWTIDKCKSESLRFKFRTDFAKGASAAYEAAKMYGWLDRVCTHMPKYKTSKNRTQS